MITNLESTHGQQLSEWNKRGERIENRLVNIETQWQEISHLENADEEEVASKRLQLEVRIQTKGYWVIFWYITGSEKEAKVSEGGEAVWQEAWILLLHPIEVKFELVFFRPVLLLMTWRSCNIPSGMSQLFAVYSWAKMKRIHHTRGDKFRTPFVSNFFFVFNF